MPVKNTTSSSFLRSSTQPDDFVDIPLNSTEYEDEDGYQVIPRLLQANEAYVEVTAPTQLNQFNQIHPVVLINCSGTCYDEASTTELKSALKTGIPSYELISKLHTCYGGINIKHYDSHQGSYIDYVDNEIAQGMKPTQLYFHLDGPGTRSCGGNLDVRNPRWHQLISILTGRGWEKNVAFSLGLISKYLDLFYGGNIPRAFILTGWSRGGITTLMLAKVLYEVFPQVPVCIFAFDPVAGLTNKNHEVTPNIHDLRIVLNATANHPYGFDPLHPSNLFEYGTNERFQDYEFNAGKNSSHKVKYYYMPGDHGSCVRKKMSDDERYKGKNLIHEICASWMRESLETWGVELNPIIADQLIPFLSDEEKLQRYNYLKMNEQRLLYTGIRREVLKHLQSTPFVNKEHQQISQNWRFFPDHKTTSLYEVRDLPSLLYLHNHLERYTELVSTRIHRDGKAQFFYNSHHKMLFENFFAEIYQWIKNKIPFNPFREILSSRLEQHPLTYEYLRIHRLYPSSEREELEMFSQWQITQLHPQIEVYMFSELFPEGSKQKELLIQRFSDIVNTLTMGRREYHAFSMQTLIELFPQTYALLVRAKLLAPKIKIQPDTASLRSRASSQLSNTDSDSLNHTFSIFDNPTSAGQASPARFSTNSDSGYGPSS